MTKFTKGPWTYRKETREIGVIDRSDTQSFGMIQVVAYIDEWDHKEYASNAHLISAAPLMLLSLANRALLCDDDMAKIVDAIEECNNEKLRELWDKIQAKACKV